MDEIILHISPISNGNSGSGSDVGLYAAPLHSCRDFSDTIAKVSYSTVEQRQVPDLLV